MWLNLNCLCAIYVCRNQRAFLAQMTSFVVRYDVIYHFFPINSQYLMTWGVDSPACGSVIFLNVAVEPRSMDTSLILTPLYNGHFHLSPRKAHLFSLKLTHFKWTTVNYRDNEHFSVPQVINSHVLSTRPPALQTLVGYLHPISVMFNTAAVVYTVLCLNYDRFLCG